MTKQEIFDRVAEPCNNKFVKTMTKQEIFDRVAAHLLKQNERSNLPFADDGCAYRGVDGLSCAVGCLIPDADYVATMEGVSIRSILLKTPKDELTKAEAQLLPVLRKLRLTGSLELLKQLQDLHDTADVSAWRSELTALAKRFKLNLKELE